MNDEGPRNVIDEVAEVTRRGLGRMSADQLDLGWQRLEHALAAESDAGARVGRRAPRRWQAGLVLAAASLAVGVVVYRWTQARPLLPLHYAVEGAVLAPGEGGETIVAGAHAPAKLTFSDASLIRMAPSTRVAVLAVDGHGSRIALANGDLDVAIQHRPGSSWLFEAGPFSVKVTGTAFRMAFDSAHGRLGLQMASGSVEVRGPTRDRVVTLHAQESLELYAKPQATLAKGAPPAVPALVAPKAEGALEAPARQASGESRVPAAAPAGPSSRKSALPPHRRVAIVDRPDTPPAQGWSKLIARGAFAAVVEDAERRGIEGTLATAGASDLTALADAARYTRRTDLAREALRALRSRYKDSERAKEAAFFLGRLAEATPSTSATAFTWYETYLKEAPDGPYADEALGRELVLLARTDRARARDVARRYVERFPHGAQAELARSLVESAAE
jgi:TolA-binding protein